MVEIFLISHEDVSVSLLQSAELILGTQKNVYTYSLKRGEDVEAFGEKISKKIEELKDFKLSISIGIAFAPNGTTFMELYRHANQALYQTKRTGKNNYKIYKNDEN
mgnify:CR=1 FL=1